MENGEVTRGRERHPAYRVRGYRIAAHRGRPPRVPACRPVAPCPSCVHRRGQAMNQPPPLTEEVFSAFLKCRYKGYLKLTGSIGEPSDYARLQQRLSAEYRVDARAA